MFPFNFVPINFHMCIYVVFSFASTFVVLHQKTAYRPVHAMDISDIHSAADHWYSGNKPSAVIAANNGRMQITKARLLRMV